MNLMSKDWIIDGQNIINILEHVPECEIIKALASVLFLFLYQLCLIELRNPNPKIASPVTI